MDLAARDFRIVIGINTAGQGLGIEFASNFQVAANFGIAGSGKGFGFNGLGAGQVAALQSGRAIGNAAALDFAGGGHIPVDGGRSIGGQAASGDIARHGKAGPRQGSACVDIAKGRNVARRS